MAGQPHRRNRWRDECSALEDKLGFSRGFIYADWMVTVSLRDRRSVCRMPIAVHEEMAFLNMIDAYVKPGSPGD